MKFIGVVSDRILERAIIGSALDNLVKRGVRPGHAEQNLLLGYPESNGLQRVALFRGGLLNCLTLLVIAGRVCLGDLA